MIFDVFRIDVALLLLLVINSVVPRPQEDATNKKDNNAVVGNIEIGDDTIQGELEIPENLDENNKNKTMTISSVLSGSVEIDNTFVKGHVNIPSGDKQQDSFAAETSLNNDRDSMAEQEKLPTDYEQQPSADEYPEGEDVINGTVELNDQNIEGHVNFPDEAIIQDSNNQQESGVIAGRIDVNDDFVQGTVHIPDDSNVQDDDVNQNEDGAITGNVELNEDYVQGTVNIPDDSNVQDDDVNQNEDGAITGNVELNEDYVQGTVNIPDDSNVQDDDGNQNEDGAITGNVELNEDYVQGTVNIPDDSNAQDNDGNQNKDGAITGNVELNEDYVQGTVNIPDDSNLQDDNGNQNEDGAITGNVELNEDYVQGTVNIPDDSNVQDDNGNQNEDGAITGNVELNEDYVQGTVDIPDDATIQDGGGNNNEDDAITGNIEINEEYIQGTINIPSDIENQLHNNQQGNVDDSDNNGIVDNSNNNNIKGTIEVDDENVQGNIEIPDSASAQVSGGADDDNYIGGNVEIGDDYVQGHIDIPDDTEKQNDDGAIVGNIDIDDDNIEGNIEIAGDSDDKTIQTGVTPKDKNHEKGIGNEVVDSKPDRECWMDVKSKLYLDALDELDDKNEKARQQFQDYVGKDFDKKMLQMLLASQGAAPRAIHDAKGDPNQIPAGINLGGYCMMRMNESLLFFHRMKLRNNTQFRVKDLATNLMNMTLLARLTMKELKLQGAYERSKTGKDPTVLYYVPTFGELGIVLENVEYKMEGRLRLLNDRLFIELVCSHLDMSNIILKYDNQTYWIYLDPKNVEDYLDRLKTDLDAWMKDYFNDYLMYFGIVGNGQDSKIQAYEKQKTVKSNEYADAVLKKIKQRIRSLGASAVQLPIFKIYSMNDIKIRLKSGVLRGLDSIYRRSVALTEVQKVVRHLDFIVSFSKLKVEYQYEAMVYRHMPPLSGTLLLSADELTAHAHVMEQDRTNSFAIDFNSITQIKPESLTIEGPANRVIADYKHILEHPLLAIMLNILTHNIKMLSTLTHCEPLFKGIDVRQQHSFKDPDDYAENKIDDEPDVGDEGENKNEVKGENNGDEQGEDNSEEQGEGNGEGQGEDEVHVEIEVNNKNEANGEDRDEDNSGSVQPLIPEEDDEDNKQWVDYTLHKNDSVEIEVPIDGETQNFKLHRDEKFVLSKIP